MVELREILTGSKFVLDGKVYLKCRTTIAQVVPIRNQVLAVDIKTGNIKSFFERVEVEKVH